MNGWRIKQAIKRVIVDTPLRTIASPLYDVLRTAELALDRARPTQSPDTSLDTRLTAMIKTFERPPIVARLVASIRERYPSLPIIVVDDSRVPTSIAGVDTVTLPYDSGVSAGRQAGLDRVRTPYVLVLDDDFIFSRATNLAPTLERLERQPVIDILGGLLIDLPLLRHRVPPVGSIFPTAALPLIPIGSRIDGLLICDKVTNFYIAQTDRLRLVGWDAALRRIDHADFFTRALGVLVTAFDPCLRAFHAQTPFDRAYMSHRMNLHHDLAILAARWNRRREPPHAVR